MRVQRQTDGPSLHGQRHRRWAALRLRPRPATDGDRPLADSRGEGGERTDSRASERPGRRALLLHPGRGRCAHREHRAPGRFRPAGRTARLLSACSASLYRSSSRRRLRILKAGGSWLTLTGARTSPSSASGPRFAAVLPLTVTVLVGVDGWRHSPCLSSHRRVASATSGQPWSMVRECPRLSNSISSVTAVEPRYCFNVAWVIASGTVRSRPPMTSSSGPRWSLWVFTSAGECREKFAVAASNNGLPGAGMVHRSWSWSDSSSGTALAKA